MKVKLLLVLIIILPFSIPEGLGQALIDNTAGSSSDLNPILSGELVDPGNTPELETFFNREWIPADIWLKDGGVLRNLPVRYNGLLDELFYLVRPDLILKPDKDAIYKFHLLAFQGDTSVYFRNIKMKSGLSDDSASVFVQFLHFENINLLIRHSFYFLQQMVVQGNNRSYLKDIYKEEPVYYLEFPDGRLIEFRKFSRKNLFKVFPEKEKQIRKYLFDSNSGIIRTQQEVISFVYFLSTTFES